MSISVLILTLDEEINISGCLESVSWSDDVVVLDSLSKDRTVEIARAHGARVVQRAFDNYANQRNFGLKEIQYKHPWLLLLDADERVPEDLRAEMLEAARTAGEAVTFYRMRRKDHLYGRWIRGSSGYPTWFGRLARVGHVWFERTINEELHTDGEAKQLRGHFDHYPFNKGFSAWIAKHDRYSSMEAELLAQKLATRWKWRDLLSGDVGARRRAAKAVMYRLPARPVAVFFALYLFRGGIFDGRAGLTFSLLRAWYEYMIDCKCVELRRRTRGLPV
jgi:glycosyltransferase involved in cell wall biosynthesis